MFRGCVSFIPAGREIKEMPHSRRKRWDVSKPEPSPVLQCLRSVCGLGPAALSPHSLSCPTCSFLACGAFCPQGSGKLDPTSTLISPCLSFLHQKPELSRQAVPFKDGRACVPWAVQYIFPEQQRRENWHRKGTSLFGSLSRHCSNLTIAGLFLLA